MLIGPTTFVCWLVLRFLPNRIRLRGAPPAL